MMPTSEVCAKKIILDKKKDFAVLSNYLSTQHNIKLNSDSTLIIMFSAFNCKGCVSNSINNIKKLITEFNKNIIVVSSNSTIKEEMFNKKISFYIDSEKKVDKLKFNIVNVGFFLTYKNELVKTFILNKEGDKESITTFLNK